MNGKSDAAQAVFGPPVNHVALMVTRRCNMKCRHCSVESRPGIKGEPDALELEHWVRDAAKAGVQSILFTGGEPMLREKTVLRLMREAKQLGLTSSMSTNGFWGKKLNRARKSLKALRRVGLVRLNVSYDRYHAEFQGPEPALNIARAAEELDFIIHIGITRVADDPDLEQIVAPFRKQRAVRLRFYDVQPVGFARNLDHESLRSEIEGFCSACNAPAITDDGRVTACNGPSYFSKESSPLYVGSLAESSFAELALRHRCDPVLDTIRTFGPARLRDELKTLAGFEDFEFRQHYSGMCELCHQITNDARAVHALREHLSRSRFEAERFAMRSIMESSKRTGLLNRDYVNGIGACRTYMRAAFETSPNWTIESDKVFGRADIDWNHQLQYVKACGLSRPLMHVLDDDRFKRWAPTFFVEQIQEQALRDGMRELLQRDALRRISTVLEDVKSCGVLLKGAAVVALQPDEQPNTPRSCGDIDIYVDPFVAANLRRKLLQTGFAGEEFARRTGPHHLAPVRFQGIPVEIHTRILPSFWGLPESEMLARAQPIQDDELRNLGTLDPAGMLLLAGIHTTTHLFAFGLKTAWDIQWIVKRNTNIDWELLDQWVGKSRVPRAFWVPLRVLASALELSIPFEFLSRAPSDARQQQLELIARHRIFQAIEGAYELNPFSKNGVFLMMHDSWFGRIRYIASLCRPETRESRRSSHRRTGKAEDKQSRGQLRDAIQHWRQFRQVVSQTHE